MWVSLEQTLKTLYESRQMAEFHIKEIIIAEVSDVAASAV